MAVEYSWPSKDKSQAIGKRVKRVDGMAKATGAAKYTYDVNLKNQLIAKGLGSPHASCTIKSIDVAPALAVPGVVEALTLKKSGDNIEFQGDLIVVVAAESEGAAREGVAACKIEYDLKPVFVKDSDLAAAKAAGRTTPGGGDSPGRREGSDRSSACRPATGRRGRRCTGRSPSVRRSRRCCRRS